MARPAKSLQVHVREGTFRARRPTHRQLLGGAALAQWPLFASPQNRYGRAGTEAERRAVALEFERLVQAAQAELQKRVGAAGAGGERERLTVELRRLGRPGSAAQLLRFFPTYLTHPKGPLLGQPFRLAGWQQRFLREFYRRDKHGRRIYRSGFLGLPRGNGKTPLAAALGLYELLARTDAPEVYCAGCSKEQAGIALGFARSFVEQGALSDWIQLRSGLLCPASSGVMKVVSSDGRMQHGRMPAVALIDELWAFETSREQQTYIAFASALHKREDAYLLAITTAGYDKSSLLGRIYEQAHTWPQVETSKDGFLTVAKDLENGQLLWWHGAPEGAAIDDPAVWRAANPAAWIKTSELKRQLADPGLDELEFRRLNLNQWTRVREAWLPDGCWQGLRCEQEIPAGGAIYVGVDVGLYHDSTAVCWAHRLEDGRILLRSHVWSAKLDAPAHTYCPDGKVALEQVEAFIRQLARDYKLRELAFDPHFFNRSAELLEDAGIKTIEFLQASGPMADAYQGFYQLALEGKLAHDGDPVFAAHIEATAASKSERGWKLSKLHNKKRIDATVAAALAVARARHPRKRKANIYWMDI